jgi:UDP-glucuronate decarboxylase
LGIRIAVQELLHIATDSTMRFSSYLVPGGAGFIGSHLCERLLAAGHEVHVVDDLSSGDVENLARLRAHRRFTFTKSDIVLPAPQSMERAEAIFNLACPASPPQYQSDPIQTTLTSCVGVWRLLDLATRAGARLLQASTSEIYGDPIVHPQLESYWGNVNPIGPRSCYDEGKRCAEALMFAYHRQRKTDIRIARLFNSYGPRLRPGDGRVVSNFIVQALRGQPLTIYGTGEQTRSFCYVDDTVDALLALMQADVTGPVNIGNPTETTVLELAETILRLTHSKSSLKWVALPVDDPVRRRPDISLAQRTLAWRPSVSLVDGLTRTIRHFKDVLEIAPATVALGAPASKRTRPVPERAALVQRAP